MAGSMFSMIPDDDDDDDDFINISLEHGDVFKVDAHKLINLRRE